MTNRNKGAFRIGTSGIVVPGGKKTFPEQFINKSRLNYYSSIFNTLEVNSTFKKIPKAATFERWSWEVEQDFQFTFKLWKEISHVKQLNADVENIDTFITAANYIGTKKGCLLIQFPASITIEYSDKVQAILQRLHQQDSESEWRKAVEFRSTSWYVPKTYRLLNKYKATIVMHDMPKSRNTDFDMNATFYYLRYHGVNGDYRGSYSTEFLAEEAVKIRYLLNNGKDVYVYFNNTMGNAYENAMSLKAMVEN